MKPHDMDTAAKIIQNALRGKPFSSDRRVLSDGLEHI
jgi:hypothetical protein